MKKMPATTAPRHDSFSKMPQASLARLMRQVGRAEVTRLHKFPLVLREKDFDSVERDCRLVSRLAFGQFAWLVGVGGSRLVQIGMIHWGRDQNGDSLAVRTAPPAFFLEEHRELGSRLLASYAGSNFILTGRFFLVDSWQKGAARVREVSGYELAGRAVAYEQCGRLDVFEDQERSHAMWREIDEAEARIAA